MAKSIKLFDPVSDKNQEQEIIKVLYSHVWASGAGHGKVTEFEEKFAKYVNSSECVAVNSGTAALHLALSLFDLKGKEILLPSLSFVSTAHAVIYNGAIPKFVDVDKQTLCIDTKDIEAKITAKTAAILPVHFGGMPCNMNELKRISRKYNFKLIEDAAHAAGSNYNGKKIGSHGDAVCFSFHPVKNLAMPNGGAITLNSKHNITRNKKALESLRWCGITKRKDSIYDVDRIGFNFYMNEFSAAIGIKQLEKLDKFNKIRRQIAKKYYEQLDCEIKMPINNGCSHQLYWIFVKNRNQFMKKMKYRGIETGIHYLPIHKMSFYQKRYKHNDPLPVTEEAGKNIVTIPIHANLTKSDVDFVIKSVNKFI